jgi:hypothetical protein
MRIKLAMTLVAIIAVVLFSGCLKREDAASTPHPEAASSSEMPLKNTGVSDVISASEPPVAESESPMATLDLTASQPPVEAKEETDITKWLLIEDIVNREALTPNGDKAHYLYQTPVILSDKPGAHAINERFLALVRDMDWRIGDGQLMPLTAPASGFLYDGILSLVLEINKPGPDGITVANYELSTDRKLSTHDLLERYQFDSNKLIEAIDKQTKINKSQQEEVQSADDILLLFALSAVSYSYSSEDFEQMKTMSEKIRHYTKAEQANYVKDNISKFKVYLRNNGAFAFVYQGRLPDEVLIVE